MASSIHPLLLVFVVTAAAAVAQNYFDKKLPMSWQNHLVDASLAPKITRAWT